MHVRQAVWGVVVGTTLVWTAAGCAGPDAVTVGSSAPAAVTSTATGLGEVASADTVVPTSASVTTSASEPTAGGGAASGVALTQPADALTRGLTVSTVIGGGAPVDMEVDTGSNGVLVSRSYIGSAATPLSPARTFSGWGYSSSGNTYSGEWMTATLQLGAPGGTDHPVQTTPLLIRVVDEDKVAMMGVGFARGTSGPDADLEGPALNPFLHLTGTSSGSMPQAYVVGLDRIVLGPTADDLAGFQTVALTRNAAGTDWAAAPSCVAVPTGGVSPQCGGLLLDTGLDYAIIQAPTGVEPPTVAATTAGTRPTIATGQQVQITMAGLSGPLYDFTVGGSGAPTSVQWGHDLADNGGEPFMNISRYALTQQDYLYDASTGQVGFRPVG